MKFLKFFFILSLCFAAYAYATDTDDKSLTLKGVLVQESGIPVPNIKVYMQKTFFPGRGDKTRVRTQFTTNDQGQLSMPFGITDEKGRFSITFPLADSHCDFAVSLRQGRASLDFPGIYLFELEKNAWAKSNQHAFNIGKVSIPEGWEVDHFEKGQY